jgi:dynamin GTPase
VVFGMIDFIQLKILFQLFSSGLFTPDEAFEYIVQMQIAKFEDPVMKCVDMVVSELLSIIHEATSKVRI